MPYVPHIKMSFIGKRSVEASFVALETWSIGLRFAPTEGDPLPEDPSQEEMTELAESVLPVATTFFTKPRFAANSHFTEARAYFIGPDGKATGNIGYGIPAAPRSGTGASDLPWQTTLVATLAAEGRGKGKFGRVYLPGPATSVLNTGTIAPSNADLWLADFKAFVTGLDTAIGLSIANDVELVVAGATGGGTLRPVRELRVGTVYDTQRRRRRSLDEAYRVTTYP